MSPRSFLAILTVCCSHDFMNSRSVRLRPSCQTQCNKSRGRQDVRAPSKAISPVAMSIIPLAEIPPRGTFYQCVDTTRRNDATCLSNCDLANSRIPMTNAISPRTACRQEAVAYLRPIVKEEIVLSSHLQKIRAHRPRESSNGIRPSPLP
jgi:hypothetical protein